GLVLAWTHAIVTGNGDVALLVEPDSRALPGRCRADADEATAGTCGWADFFSPMTHLCVFSSQLDLQDFMAARGAGPLIDEWQELGSVDNDGAGDEQHAWGQDPNVRAALEGTATDQVRAMSRVLHHLRPRLQGIVHSVLREQCGGVFSDKTKAGKYVGMFVHETEGRSNGLFKATETLDCFERASKYLEDLDKYAAGYILASEISGVALVSEDATALAEAKNIVRRYFRNVKSEHIVKVVAGSSASPLSNGEGNSVLSNKCGNPDIGDGDALVQFLAELELMAQADVFVGVASEGFSRLVFLVREALQITRRTSLSMDRKVPFPDRISRSRL
ncbi:unnamed protein product, partial [Hapterophycus canaliculatus]